MPIDHTGIVVPQDQHKQVVDFYLHALEPLGYSKIIDESGKACGLGVAPKPDFWIMPQQGSQPVTKSKHVAFNAKDHSAVDAFYGAATKAGGSDNGAPGPRAQYHPKYYSAYVKDPLGNNVECVCHI